MRHFLFCSWWLSSLQKSIKYSSCWPEWKFDQIDPDHPTIGATLNESVYLINLQPSSINMRWHICWKGPGISYCSCDEDLSRNPIDQMVYSLLGFAAFNLTRKTHLLQDAANEINIENQRYKIFYHLISSLDVAKMQFMEVFRPGKQKAISTHWRSIRSLWPGIILGDILIQRQACTYKNYDESSQLNSESLPMFADKR